MKSKFQCFAEGSHFLGEAARDVTMAPVNEVACEEAWRYMAAIIQGDRDT